MASTDVETQPSVPDLSGREAWTYRDYVRAGRDAVSRSAWELGDLAAGVPSEYGKNTLARYAEAIGVAYSTLRNYKAVAERFPQNVRRRTISWGVHRELAGLDDAARVLEGRKAWTVKAARELAAGRRTEAGEREELTARVNAVQAAGHAPRALTDAALARDWDTVRKLTEEAEAAVSAEQEQAAAEKETIQDPDPDSRDDHFRPLEPTDTTRSSAVPPQPSPEATAESPDAVPEDPFAGPELDEGQQLALVRKRCPHVLRLVEWQRDRIAELEQERDSLRQELERAGRYDPFASA